MPRPESRRPDYPRIVRPRKQTGSANKPVIAVHEDEVLCEDGRRYSYSDLPTLIITEPSSIIVCHLPGHLLRDLDACYRGSARWQFRVSPIEREVWGPNKAKRNATIRDTSIAYFGFKGVDKKAGLYHYPVSPVTFCLQTANAIRRGVAEDDSTVYKLLQWGLDLRSFLVAQGLAVRPSSGGIAAQLLRDPRFYPEVRRKVPRATNALVREFLPGNYYRLYAAQIGKPYKATYLDQASSHHSIAKRLAFPNANTLKRRGRWETRPDRPYVRHTSKHFDELLSEFGLFLVGVRIPHRPRGTHFLPPAVMKPMGLHYVYLYSNELAYVRLRGVQIESIVAHWTSPDREDGLNRYAEWALEQLDDAETERKRWLKPTLLSTYGVLAAKARYMEFGYAQAKGCEPKRYPCGSGFLDVLAKRATKEHEMTTANVIHRGMIEAETRLVSLAFAEKLHTMGHTVLAIYADSVFVTSNQQLPLLEEPWKVEAHLTNLRFLSAVAFKSHELEKLPGVPAAERDRARLPVRRRKVVRPRSVIG